MRARIADGEPYHDALGTELRAGGFALAPVFNWRFPGHLGPLGRLPWPHGGQLLFSTHSEAAVVVTFLGVSRRGYAVAVSGTLLVQFLGFSAPTALLFSETWAALFLTASAEGVLLDRPWLRMAGATGALLYRELAAPWCAGLTLWALWRGRRREGVVWCALGTLYLALRGVHARQALHATPAAAVRNGWVTWGGARQVLAAVQWFVLALLVPALGPWTVVAVALAVAAPRRLGRATSAQSR